MHKMCERATLISKWSVFLLLFTADAIDISPKKQISWSIDKDCHRDLENFGDAASNYTFCAIKSSRPFRFCCKCKKFYVSSLTEYAYLKRANCSDELSAEKYQIVESTHLFVQDLWERSNCPRCFVNDLDGIPEKIKDDVSKFFQKMSVVEHCFYNNSQIHIIPVPIKNATNHTAHNISSINPVCDHCKAAYHDLRSAYQGILETANSQETKVCADVSAAMTFVRQRWSYTFHCLQIHEDLVSVIALTCFFCFLPIVFYTSVKLNGDSEAKQKRTPLKVNYAGSDTPETTVAKS